jgi:hypothetical protein
MAVRLDKWQNIVGVGWGGIRALLLATNNVGGGRATSTGWTEISKTTRDALEALGFERFGISVPFDEIKRSLSGYGVIEWSSLNDDPVDGYKTSLLLDYAKELPGALVTFRAVMNIEFDSEEDEQGATVPGSTSYILYLGTQRFAYDDVVAVANDTSPVAGFRYDGTFATSITGTLNWSHGPGDIAWRSTVFRRAFYVNWTINAKTGEIGDAFFTSQLTEA